MLSFRKPSVRFLDKLKVACLLGLDDIESALDKSLCEFLITGYVTNHNLADILDTIPDELEEGLVIRLLVKVQCNPVFGFKFLFVLFHVSIILLLFQ